MITIKPWTHYATNVLGDGWNGRGLGWSLLANLPQKFLGLSKKTAVLMKLDMRELFTENSKYRLRNFQQTCAV